MKRQHNRCVGGKKSCNRENPYFPGRRVTAEISLNTEVTGAKLQLCKTTTQRAWACCRQPGSTGGHRFMTMQITTYTIKAAMHLCTK